MADERLRNKSELKRLFTNLRGKNITEEMMSIAIDSLWRDKLVQRTSGFEFPGHFDSEISFNTSTRIFSIKPWDPLVEGFIPRYGIYSYLDHPIFHRHFEPFEIEIPNEEGLFCVYFDNEPEPGSSLILFYKKNPTQQELEDIYVSKILVSCLYWDATNDELLHFGEDRHGSEWNPHIQWYLHTVFGAKRTSGLQFTGYQLNADGLLNSHAKFSITTGSILHDDIKLVINASSTTIPVLYSDSNKPRFLTKTGYAFAGSPRPYFNSGLNSLTVVTSGNYVLYHIFATNEILSETRKIISVMGTSQYLTIGEAFKGIESELDSIYTYLPYQGRCYLGTVIYQTDDAYSNSVNTRIVTLTTEKPHNPVSIHDDSAAFGSIDDNQVLTLTEPTWQALPDKPHIPDDVDLYLNDVLVASNIGNLKLVQGTKITITYNVNGELVFNVQAPDLPLTENSVQGDGTLASKIKLINDAPAPGTNKYYGTNEAGIKGYHDTPQTGAKTWIELTDTIPSTFIGKAKNVPMVTDAEEGLDLVETQELETVLAKFTHLSDVPNNYENVPDYYLKAKADGTGLYFSQT